jgi:hypothetical protein
LPKANQLVYRTPWFLGLLEALSLNLCACALSRYASWPRRVGSVITHVSILLVFAGAIVDGIWGQRGMMRLQVNQTLARFGEGDRQGKLPFAIRLREFTVERCPARPSLTLSDMTHGQMKQQLALNVGAEGKIGRTGWALRAEETRPNVEECMLLSATGAGTGALGGSASSASMDSTRVWRKFCTRRSGRRRRGAEEDRNRNDGEGGGRTQDDPDRTELTGTPAR